MNHNGQVIAINAAILPEFGGSNIGVPVSHLQDLLVKTEDEAKAIIKQLDEAV